MPTPATPATAHPLEKTNDYLEPQPVRKMTVREWLTGDIPFRDIPTFAGASQACRLDDGHIIVRTAGMGRRFGFLLLVINPDLQGDAIARPDYQERDAILERYADLDCMPF